MHLLVQCIFANLDMTRSVCRKYHFSVGQQREQSAFGGCAGWDAWLDSLSCTLGPASSCYSSKKKILTAMLSRYLQDVARLQLVGYVLPSTA